MFCSGCGQPLLGSQHSCPKCGKRAEATGAPSQPPVPMPRIRLEGKLRTPGFVLLANVAWNIILLSVPFGHVGTSIMVVSLMLSGASILSGLIGAVGLFKLQAWGRPASIIAAIIALVNPNDFPVGTALGIWALVVLLNARNAAAYKELCNLGSKMEIPASSPKNRTDLPPESDMGSPSIGSEAPPAYCPQCGCKLGMPARFCNNCGAPIASGIPNPMGPTSHLGAAAPYIGAQENPVRAQLQQVESHRLARRELIIAAVLALIGWLMLANQEDFALQATSSQELAWFKLTGMALVVGGIVVGLRGAARYRG